MKILSFVGLALLLAAPARAASILWFDDGALSSVSEEFTFQGLTVGTPWTLHVAFDPAGPGTPVDAGFPGCNSYPIQSATFTMGGFTYTTAGGQVKTSAAPPGGCSPILTSEIMFEFTRPWTQEPGAWDLSSGILVAAYRDLMTPDGTLPTVPSPSGFGEGLNFYTLMSTPFPAFQDFNFDPTLVAAPVPEPGTMMMLGLGLAIATRRRLLKRN